MNNIFIVRINYKNGRIYVCSYSNYKYCLKDCINKINKDNSILEFSIYNAYLSKNFKKLEIHEELFYTDGVNYKERNL